MSFVHCQQCAASFDVRRAARCPRCGTFLGASASVATQVAACVDRLGHLLATASPAQRAELADSLRATPPCADVEVTRWTNAVSGAVADTMRAPVVRIADDDVRYQRASALMLGFWLGVVTTVRQLAAERLAARWRR